ncbi:hypothetical protein PanWU01x14_207220 [Parasponia andersonii]|uniref:Uncharacterized protein n=1 Tax=Parasponia andersonii TaxID=3476 RepID=A0A2P5BVE5_PARAD|nr:hypothetical protein PanWU01x14_207220 [Parasponia andersonii]
MIGATRDQMYRAAVAQPVTILTHTDGQPTSTNFPLSPTDVDQPVKSIAEYILAREKIMWKNEYEYDTGLDFSFSSCSSVLSSGSRGFPAPSHGKPVVNFQQTFLYCEIRNTDQESSVYSKTIVPSEVPKTT